MEEIKEKGKIDLLPIEFEGVGEVAGYKFKQIEKTDKGYIYEATTNVGLIHYEVVKRETVNKMLDFKNKIVSEDKKEIYPKSKHFGKTGWQYNILDEAVNKLNTL